MYPTTVLGAVTAERLGISDLEDDPLVWLGGQWFTVVGILDTLELSADLDRAALIGAGAAETYLDADLVPSTLYVRTVRHLRRKAKVYRTVRVSSISSKRRAPSGWRR